MPKLEKRLFQRIRVPLGFVFAGVFLIFSKPTPLLLAIGLSIGLVGLAIRAWSSGHIEKNQKLAISGPYAFTRNPLYLGSFILGLGVCAGSGKWWLALLFVALFLGIYLPVMSVEADELTAIFGDEYERYSKKVPLFFPGVPLKSENAKKFDMSLYMRYREYRALVGFFIIFLVLFAKFYFVI